MVVVDLESSEVLVVVDVAAADTSTVVVVVLFETFVFVHQYQVEAVEAVFFWVEEVGCFAFVASSFHAQNDLCFRQEFSQTIHQLRHLLASCYRRCYTATAASVA